MELKKPSITELIELLNKPALLTWANNLGLQGISLYAHKQSLRKKGISIHQQIKNFEEHGTPFIEKEVQQKWQYFMQNKKMLAMEQSVESKWFTGRYDAKIYAKGKVYIGDFKSSNEIYFEHILQLVAYRMVEKVDGIAVISIPDFKFTPINIEDFSVWENTIKCLHYIHKTKNSYDVQNLIQT